MTPHEQIRSLITVKMFNTATSFCDMILESGFDGISMSDYTSLQWERGLYFFKTKKNYKAARKVFTKWHLPTEQLVILFSEIYPNKYVDDMMTIFKMNKADVKGIGNFLPQTKSEFDQTPH